MQDPDRQIWDGMLAHLRAHHATICRQWFEELEPAGVAAGALQLRTQSHLHRDYLRRQCSEPFNDAARTVSGRLLSVRFLGPEDEVIRQAPPGKRDVLASLPSTAPTPPSPAPPANTVSVAPAPDAAHAGMPAQPAPMEMTAPIPAEKPADPVSGSASGPVGGAPAAPVAPAADAGRLHSQIEPQPLRPNGQHVPPRRTPSVVEDRPRTRYESLVVNPDYGFENFVVGPNNRLAHAAAQAVAGNPGRAYNPYFVHGGVGLGKTHLLQAVCLRIVEANPRAQVYYTSCEGFVSQFFESVQSGEMAEFRHRFRDVDVLVIDDIHFLTKRDRSQEEFFHTFNSLFQANKQIILSSDAPPEDIPDLEERLVSRFKWGLVAKIEAPDYETRIQILKTKARLRGLVMPDDVAEFIAARIDSNIRELEGAVVKLQIQSVVEKCPIDLSLARAALGVEAEPTGGEPTIQSIINAVTDYYGIRLADLQSKHRQRSIALPRQVCMFLARRCTRHSLKEINGFFNKRDHTTVMHAIRTIDHRRTSQPEFDGVLKSLEDRIRTGGKPAS